MSCYREIMNNDSLPSQFKKYISIIDSLKSKSIQQKIAMEEIIPDILLVSECQVRDIVHSFCQYLAEEKIVEFIGENKVLNIRLKQINDGREIYDLCNKINDMFVLSGSFRGKFKGVVCVNISDVKYFDSGFTKIMKYIKNNSEGCFRIIVSDNMKEYKIKDAEQALSMASYRIYTVERDSLLTEKAYIFLKVKLEEYGFSLNEEAEHAVKIILTQLIESHKLRNIYDVNEYLCNDLLFFLFGQDIDNIITEDHINKYFKQCLICCEKKKENHHIGFIDVRGE